MQDHTGRNSKIEKTAGTDRWMEMPANSIAMNTFSGVTIESRFTPEHNANNNFHMLAYFGDTKNAVGIEYSAGQHLVRFDGSYFASGVYFYTIELVNSPPPKK